MDDFETAFAAVLKFEGGYSKVRNDPGRETYMGVSRKAHERWQGWAIIDRYKRAHGPIRQNAFIRDPTLDFLVKEVYRNEYWAPVAAQGFPRRLTMKMFEVTVNRGKNGVALLQRIVGSNPDGAWGPKTRAAVAAYLVAHGCDGLLRDVCQAQEAHYREWCANPKHKGFNLDFFLKRAWWLPA